MKMFLLNLSKRNSRELLMIGIVLARYSASSTIYGTVDPCELNFLVIVHLIVSVPQYRCSSSKAEIPPRRNIYIYIYQFMKFLYSKILE